MLSQETATTNKHGTPKKTTIIRATGDDYPIVDGTVEIKPKEGWFEYVEGASKMVLHEDIWQLFIDAEMMTNAR